MNYELSKELKDAGFPQDHDCIDGKELGDGLVGACLCLPTMPTLSELIEACGEEFVALMYAKKKHKWVAQGIKDNPSLRGSKDFDEYASTPEEAVARLWLALNKKI